MRRLVESQACKSGRARIRALAAHCSRRPMQRDSTLSDGQLRGRRKARTTPQHRAYQPERCYLRERDSRSRRPWLSSVGAEFAARKSAIARRAGTPELPPDPTAAQVDAWLELTELAADPDFRDTVRRNAELVLRAHQRRVRPGQLATPVGAGLHPRRAAHRRRS